MHQKNNIAMRIREFIQRHTLTMLEAALLMGLLTVIWRVENSYISFVCGISAGLLFYRLGDRISQHQIRKA
ncbi:hypothetical protein [Chitinophaga solisilvae]|uniref:Uncharacterized protein n=1 Tax=Chitinophaga solisilvae TaxID=1233460 RepID=A0A9Q5GW92_9BACT|nr:hypothetical protein [Chitinophaga solisilvae]NSL88568.1 hypothetical protein [Chitinophaga solisilvae]